MRVRDFLDADVDAGDVVIFTLPKYSELKIGTVVKVNPKSVTVEYDGTDGRILRTTRFKNQFVILE